MNHAIIGKPGGGKGMLAVNLVVDELVSGKRPIITDVAFEKMPWVTGSHEPRRGLLSYLREKHGKEFDAGERLFRLTPEAQLNYYLYRALNREQVEKLGAMHMIGYKEVTPLDNVLVPDEWIRFHKDYKLYVADHESHLDKRGRKIVDTWDTRLAIASGGHLVITDEAWSKWPARGWSNTAEGILYYYSMVRRFGDDNWITSQRSGDIDKILMDRCQDYWVCNNHGKLRWGFWKQPAVFLVSVYDHAPTTTSEPMHRKPFFLDRKGLAQCYDTSGGVGVAGRVMADTTAQAKGLPFWTIFLFGALAIGGVIMAVSGCQHTMTRVLSGKKKPAVTISEGKNVSEKMMTAENGPAIAAQNSAKTPENANAGKKPGLPAEDQALSNDFPKRIYFTNAFPVVVMPPPLTNELYCTGIFFVDRVGTIFLSDGTSVDTDSGRVGVINKLWVEVDGYHLPIKRARTLDLPENSVRPFAVGGSSVVEPVPSVFNRPERPFAGGIQVTPGVHGAGNF